MVELFLGYQQKILEVNLTAVNFHIRVFSKKNHILS